jgi:hypothetical protein
VSDYVDLKRNFVPVAEDAELELAVGQLWGRRYGGWLGWPEVLDHARVVLLAEAQSGKTEEFKHTAAELRDGGSPAFYATIEQLADRRLSFSPAERALFETWKAGTDRAWFFLDSVDEARLNRKRFDDALRHLAAELGTELGRASILVSSRVSDWKGKSDHRAILDIVPVPRPAPAPAAASAGDRDAALLDPIFERKETEQVHLHRVRPRVVNGLPSICRRANAHSYILLEDTVGPSSTMNARLTWRCKRPRPRAAAGAGDCLAAEVAAVVFPVQVFVSVHARA